MTLRAAANSVDLHVAAAALIEALADEPASEVGLTAGARGRSLVLLTDSRPGADAAAERRVIASMQFAAQE